MNSVKASLSAKYLYVRCDSEFQLRFTNDSVLPFWKGFYCLLTEDLQKYNTNNELDIVSDDSASIWWLSSDTLIMNVTDINTDLLQIGVESNLAQLQSDNLKLNYLSSITNLLISIQNSLSTFLNAYVEANSVADYGFQQGNIGNDGVCNVYIAKPSSTNKYHFNCKISFFGNITGNIVDGERYAGLSPTQLVSMSGINITTSGGNLYLNLPSKNIVFNLYDNSNELLTGYTVSNVSIVSSFNFSGTVSSTWTGVGQQLRYDKSMNGVRFSSCSYSDGKFLCDGPSTIQITDVSSSNTPSGIVGSEQIDITFDISKV